VRKPVHNSVAKPAPKNTSKLTNKLTNKQKTKPTARPAQRGKPNASWDPISISAIVLFVVLYLLLNLKWALASWWAISYLALSLLSLLIYAIDKSAARAGRQRIPENSLHVVALLGGWPGALLAQQWLRHKSSKLSFRIVCWCTVVLNIAVFMLLNTPLLAVLDK
jgi:uncharacterized membrane protein YsdA (DUF1294 family)